MRDIQFDWNTIGKNLNSELSENEKKIILQIIEENQLMSLYRARSNILISCYKIVNSGEYIISGHKFWRDEYTLEINTPMGLPRVNEDSKAENELFNIGLDYIDSQSGGMSSMYGYNGFYLSTIMDLVNYCIIDARGVEAT